MVDRYLVILGAEEPALVVGPFQEGKNPLDFPLPIGFDTAIAHETLESAMEEANFLNTPET